MSQLDLELIPRMTVYGAIVEACSRAKSKMVYVPHSSLNEKYGVYPNEIPDLNIIPGMDWWSLGRGSTYAFAESDGSNSNRNFVHDPLDASLFVPLPFVMRKVGEDDLDPTRRRNYALRAIINHGGESYVAYYLKKVNRDATQCKAEIVIPPATDADNEQRNELVGDPAHLSPSMKQPTPGTVRDDGAYVAVTANVECVMDAWEVQEALAAKQILTGTTQCEITEIGFFTGVPVTKTVQDGSNNFSYEEALRAQLNLVTPHRFMLNNYVKTELRISQNLGVNNPTNFAFQFS